MTSKQLSTHNRRTKIYTGLGTRMAACFCLWLCAGSVSAATLNLDFETLPDGGTPEYGDRVFGYPEAGVEFNNPVEIVACDEDGVIVGEGPTNCRMARSGSYTTRTLLATEFRREIYDVSFSGPVDSVTAYVRYDGSDALDGEDVAVVINAFNESGSFIGSRTIRFTHDYDDGAWHELSFTPPPPIFGGDPETIHRIEIWGGLFPPDESPTQISAENFLLVDDLTFSGDLVEPPEDNESPEIQIDSPPSGTVVEGETVDVDLRVEENQRLASIDGRVEHESGAVELDFSGGNICGAAPRESCPEMLFDESVTMPLGGLQGEYTLTFRACDTSDNCAEAALNVRVSRPRVLAVEVNQGVAPRLWLPGDDAETALDLMIEGDRTLPIVPERDTAVRLYLGAGGAPLNDVTAQLVVEVFYHDGSNRTWVIEPNTGLAEVDVPEAPEDISADDLNEQLLIMRASSAATLNYVISSEALANADSMTLDWERDAGALEGMDSLGVSIGQSARLGLIITQVIGPSTGGLVPRSTIEDNILPFVESMFPISGDILTSWQPFFFWGGPGDRDNFCYALTDDVRRAYWGSGAPSGADYSTVIGFAQSLTGCGGYGFYDTQGAISQAQADTAAQEIAHNMGLNHTGNSHNEDGGGRMDWENWPYDHGTIGASRLEDSPPAWGNFGAVMQQTSASGPDDFGEWQLWLVDPCPGAGLAGRIPDCAAADSSKPHDFMSYGPGIPIGPFGNQNWISDVNYYRAYRWITRRVLDPPVRWLGRGSESPATLSIASSGRPEAGASLQPQQEIASASELDGEDQVEALLVSALIHGDSVESFELLRKPIAPEFLSKENGAGSHRFEFLDDQGNVLMSHRFDPVQTTSHGEPAHSIQGTLGLKEGIASVRLLLDGELLFEQEASPNLPAVQVLEPNGGEVLAQGPYALEWEASDADNDTLRFLVQYSPDGGETWQPLGMVSGQTREIEIMAGNPAPGRKGLLSVSATDGLSTARDESDGFFSMGTAAPPDPEPEILSIETTEPAEFLLSIRGQPEEEYAIEVSTDLETWNEAEQLPFEEPIETFTDPNSNAGENKFYRVRHLP